MEILLVTRLLIQADSGGGKTYLLRLLAEQLFGKVPVIIIDPEGEFASLREKFGYLLVGKDGDTPADPRSAALLAHKLLEFKASAVCDLYEMKPSQRHEWVRLFLDAMIDAPKTLWHPTVVVVDEAHMFCPEKGKGESTASESMIALCTRGRKRGYCAVWATQRLATLNKDATSMLLNRLIGPTFEDVNRKRAAEVLGVLDSDKKEFFKSIQTLDPGNFYAIGRAISRERILVKVNAVTTTHQEIGAKHSAAPPPPPESIVRLLPKLADLPKTAEEKAKTEAELRGEIRSLKAQLRAQPTATKEVPVADPKAIEAAVSQVRKKAQDFQKLNKQLLAAIKKDVEKLWQTVSQIDPSLGPNLDTPTVHRVSVAFVNKAGHVTLPTPKVAPHATNGDASLTGPQRKILTALAELVTIGKEVAPKPMVAAWAGYSPEGGAFGNPIGQLNTTGLVRYPQPGFVSLTEEGAAKIGPAQYPDQAEIRRRIESVCTGPERKIISVLLDHGRDEIPKRELAERAGYSEIGGAFGNPLGALRTKGLLDYPRPGIVKAADWLFFE